MVFNPHDIIRFAAYIPLLVIALLPLDIYSKDAEEIKDRSLTKEDAQGTETKTKESLADGEPLAPTDANSQRLFSNYYTVIGQDRYISHIVARGSFKYGRKDAKQFELYESARGDRIMILRWRFGGRELKETLVVEFQGHPWKTISKQIIKKDNSREWERIFLEHAGEGGIESRWQYGETAVSNGTALRTKPLSEQEFEMISGQYAEVPYWHFWSNFLILQPYLNADGYSFNGITQLPAASNRKVYEVSHPWDRYLMFDKEKSLLIQWGGTGILGGRRIDISYLATAFKRVDGILFPSKVSVMAKGSVLGTYTIDTIEIEGYFDERILYKRPEMLQ